MTQKMSQGIVQLAGTVCCPGRTAPARATSAPLRNNRQLPGTITGKPGVRYLAGTVFAYGSR